MAMRSIGNAAVTFGMVCVPAKIYSATDSDNKISFNMIHRGCGSRLKQQYICEKEGSLVPADQRDKGYEFSKDQYVIFSPDELKALEEKSSGTIDIAEFIPANKIDSIYCEKSYFLAPNKGGAKAFSLLVEAMKESGQVAIAHYSARGKAHIVMLRPMDGGIVMQQLLYQNEVRSISDVPLDPKVIQPAELNLALQLVNSLRSTSFDPSKYKDTVKERIMKAVEDKIAGKPVDLTAADEPPKTDDIMAALMASLAVAPVK